MQSSGYQAVDVWKQNMKQPVSVRIMHVKVLTVSYRGKYMDPEPATYTRIPLVIGVIHGDAESPMLVHVGIGIHPMCHENRDFCLEVCKRLWSLLDMDTQIGTDQWPPILHWEAHIPSNSARCEFLEDVYKMQNFARSATKFLAWSTHSGREGSIEAEVYYRPPQSLLASAAPTPRAPGAVHILEPNDFLEDDDADYYGDGCEDSSESDN
ncbi:hypothetical protein C8T65DRAFT_739920 [Cerioporus squamosus]|nr:hypothetical protein C8T65DRAFT_739920 [Cerioporus squamosus]